MTKPRAGCGKIRRGGETFRPVEASKFQKGNDTRWAIHPYRRNPIEIIWIYESRLYISDIRYDSCISWISYRQYHKSLGRRYSAKAELQTPCFFNNRISRSCNVSIKRSCRTDIIDPCNNFGNASSIIRSKTCSSDGVYNHTNTTLFDKYGQNSSGLSWIVVTTCPRNALPSSWSS